MPLTYAHAQSQTASSASALAEVVVTAPKRGASLLTAPVSVSVTTGADLQARGIGDLTTLAQATPSVSLKSEGPGQTEIEMRGMTSSGGNSATVGFYLDGVPMTAPSGAQNGKVVIDPNLYDLDEVEVLRGPEATLYGAGSMGGAIHIVTNQPDLTGFHASGESTLSGTEGGGFNHADNLMLNIPIVQDKLALRIVGTEAYTSGWIDRIVAGDFPLVSANGATRGDVAAAPVEKSYPSSNAEQLYGVRASLLWQATPNLTITPAVLYQTDHQDGISAYDSDPGTDAHYQPFDIAEPNSDTITILSLAVHYSTPDFNIDSTTAQWWRRSIQVEDGSEDFNNPNTGVTYATNNGLANPSYYGASGSGEVYGREDDPSHQFSEDLRVSSKGGGPLSWTAGVFYSDFSSTWTFAGTTENPSAYMDLGTYGPATTTSWFDAYSPTSLSQYALYGQVGYAITPKLKATLGMRWYDYDYRYLSVISGWGSALGAATPSSSGVIKQDENGFDPKVDLSYTFSRDLMAYVAVGKGTRPGGGNAAYPTTGSYWSAAFAPYNFSGGKWPSSYKSDSVWSYEIGEKARLLDQRLTVNASLYYEDWRNIQLEALPGDWPLNINGEHATIYGGELQTIADLGAGFNLSASAADTDASVDPGPHWLIEPLHKLSDVAPVNGDLVLSYTRRLSDAYTFDARLENTYVGKRFSLNFPYGYTENGEYTALPSYDLTNIRFGIKASQGWTIAFFVNNVFNQRAQLENLLQETLPSAAFARIVTNQPLTGGIDISVRL